MTTQRLSSFALIIEGLKALFFTYLFRKFVNSKSYFLETSKCLQNLALLVVIVDIYSVNLWSSKCLGGLHQYININRGVEIDLVELSSYLVEIILPVPQKYFYIFEFHPHFKFNI